MKRLILGNGVHAEFQGIRHQTVIAKKLGLKVALTVYSEHFVPSAAESRIAFQEINRLFRARVNDLSSAPLFDSIFIGNEFCWPPFWDKKCAPWSNDPKAFLLMSQEADRFVRQMMIPALEVLPKGSVWMGATWCDQATKGRLFDRALASLQKHLGQRPLPVGFACHTYTAHLPTMEENLKTVRTRMEEFRDWARKEKGESQYQPLLGIPEWASSAFNAHCIRQASPRLRNHHAFVSRFPALTSMPMNPYLSLRSQRTTMATSHELNSEIRKTK